MKELKSTARFTFRLSYYYEACNDNTKTDKCYPAAPAHSRSQFLPYPPVSQLVLLVSIYIAIQL